ncbi:lactate dehydrogenase [Ligilactobacillus faecis]|uniref:Lactate dehydrogenase n=1 Tax=Ligilactobacillus faecis TaxID=762833 RepID=A0ABV4DM12_9LACO|nr:lactate dehydrogenase [Ligilactobacillus faecis]WGN89416.1 lactate dehydrogenase [Ligilactobacillus faecis]
MENNLMVCGISDELTLFLNSCILHDDQLHGYLFQISDHISEQMQTLLANAELADNFTLEATMHPKWDKLELLLIGPAPIEFVKENEKNTQRKWTQLIINQAMANGFKGKICFVTPDDHLWVYSALRFSGLPASDVFGLGTMPLSEVVALLLGRQLDLGSDPIYANVIGTTSDSLITWSRAQIAGNLILSLVAQDKSLFGQANLDEIEKTYQEKERLMHTMMTTRCLRRVIKALFFNHPILVPLTHEVEFATQKIALSEPVVIAKQGIKHMAKLNLSEEEKQTYLATKQKVVEELERLRKN